MNSILTRAAFDLGVAACLSAVLAVVFVCDQWLIPAPAPLTEEEIAQLEQSGEGSVTTGNLLSARNIYSLRTAENREEIVQQMGGTQVSEQSVVAGLDWLARHQAQDGPWSQNHVGIGPTSVCEPQSRCGDFGQPFAAAQTGLALLAFQAGGHYADNQAEHSNTVRRGLDWLVEHQRENGGIHGVEHGAQVMQYMYEHGIAAFALAEACAVALASNQQPDPRYLKAAERAIAFIEQEQHHDGGWRYSSDPHEQSDTSVSGWQVSALKSAKQAQISVNQECIDKADAFFDSCLIDEANGRTGYETSRQLTEATTGVGMLVRQFLLDEGDSAVVANAAKYLAGFAADHWGQGRTRPADYYLWYNCTLAMHHAGGDEWDRWNGVVRDAVIALQVHEGCERGSWPVDDHYGGTGGRVYTTALAVLTLEVYYRFATDVEP